jgi:hypothetical protein
MARSPRIAIGQPCGCEFVAFESLYIVSARGAVDQRTIASLRCDCDPEGGYDKLFGSRRPRLRRNKGWVWEPTLMGRVTDRMLVMLPAAEARFRMLAARMVSILSADPRLAGPMRLSKLSAHLWLRLNSRHDASIASVSYAKLSVGFTATDLATGVITWRYLDFARGFDGRMRLDPDFKATDDPELQTAFEPLNGAIEIFTFDLLKPLS